ncbi:MAG: ABC transporter ATP-binding protein [Candidatus Cloacimonadota bacterium]|nr:ABC transporter ATP-binding protein [Candidatus Cloacimonadota bacterium]
MKFKELFKSVIPYIKEAKHKFLLGIFVLFIVNSIQLVVPKIMQWTIDSIRSEDFGSKHIAIASSIIIGLTLIMAVMRYYWRIIIIGNAWDFERKLRKDFYIKLMQLSRNYFNKSQTGDLMAHATNDLQAVRMFFGMGFVASADVLLITVASLIFMVGINLKLTLLAIIPLPLLTIIIAIMGKKMHLRSHDVQSSFSSMTGFIQESISGIRVIKAFSQEKSEAKRMDGFALDYVHKNLKLVRLQGMFHPMMGLIISFSMLIVLVQGGSATIKNEISIGEFIAFFSYLGMLAWPMIAVGWIINLYQRGTASLKRLNKIFNEKTEIFDDNIDNTINHLDGNLDIRNLTFRYNQNSPNILHNINLQIKAGETLAIVGPTGSGKTTLVDLLVRIYNSDKDSIFFDNHEIFKIPLNILHQDLVMVPQDIFLFSDSIANNIALSNTKASRNMIEEAAKKADVYKDIINFEKGFDTVVGERGVTLSGGQKQRIAIARALMTNPIIMILDDALSAVDTKTEEKILRHLIDSRKNKSTIIISHRISSIKHADKIVVLDNTKIQEKGNHTELLAKNGLYKTLFDKQQIEEKIEQE